jgi:hypothetical protein
MPECTDCWRESAWLGARAFLRPRILMLARPDLPKLAVILHRMWVDGTEFNWSMKKAAA